MHCIFALVLALFTMTRFNFFKLYSSLVIKPNMIIKIHLNYFTMGIKFICVIWEGQYAELPMVRLVKMMIIKSSSRWNCTALNSYYCNTSIHTKWKHRVYLPSWWHKHCMNLPIFQLSRAISERSAWWIYMFMCVWVWVLCLQLL